MAFIKQYTVLLFSLVVASIAYQLSLLESQNLWDYLLDPLISLYAIIMMLSRRLLLSFSKRKQV